MTKPAEKSSEQRDFSPQAKSTRLEWAKIIFTFLTGIVSATAVIVAPNYEKLFPPASSITVKSVGYNPSQDIKKEMEVFFTQIGWRDQVSIMIDASLRDSSELKSIREQYPNNKPLHRDLEQAYRREAEFMANIIKDRTLDRASAIYSLDEVQQLNKFFSSEAMRGYVKKQPQLSIQVFELLPDLIEESQSRIELSRQAVLQKYGLPSK